LAAKFKEYTGKFANFEPIPNPFEEKSIPNPTGTTELFYDSVLNEIFLEYFDKLKSYFTDN
jgi:hypothetical protein